MKNKTLSDKRDYMENYGYGYPEKDVAKAVHDLKEMNCKLASKREYFMLWSTLNQEVDKIFGEFDNRPKCQEKLKGCKTCKWNYEKGGDCDNCEIVPKCQEKDVCECGNYQWEHPILPSKDYKPFKGCKQFKPKSEVVE